MQSLQPLLQAEQYQSIRCHVGRLKAGRGLLEASRQVTGGDSSGSQLRKESRGSPVLASTAAFMSAAMLSTVLLSGLYGMVTAVP